MSEWLNEIMVPRYPYGAWLALGKCDTHTRAELIQPHVPGLGCAGANQ